MPNGKSNQFSGRYFFPILLMDFFMRRGAFLISYGSHPLLLAAKF